jgi:DNA-binding MarR family transcriptional regulator
MDQAGGMDRAEGRARADGTARAARNHRHNQLLRDLSSDQRTAWLGLLDVHSRMTKELGQELERAHGLSLSDYSVLAALVRNPEGRMRMSELADHASISRPGMTRLIERLEREGLVDRDRNEADSRQVYATITERGLEVLAEATESHFAGVRSRFWDKLSASQTRALAGAWLKVLGERPSYVDLDDPEREAAARAD